MQYCGYGRLHELAPGSAAAILFLDRSWCRGRSQEKSCERYLPNWSVPSSLPTVHVQVAKTTLLVGAVYLCAMIMVLLIRLPIVPDWPALPRAPFKSTQGERMVTSENTMSAGGQCALQDMVELQMYLVAKSHRAPWPMFARSGKKLHERKEPHRNPIESSAAWELLDRGFIEGTSSQTFVVSTRGYQFYQKMMIRLSA